MQMPELDYSKESEEQGPDTWEYDAGRIRHRPKPKHDVNAKRKKRKAQKLARRRNRK